MRILAVSNFPVEAAATRFRVAQFVEPLRERGIELDVRPFLNSEQFERMYASGGTLSKAAGMLGSVLRRSREVLSSRRYDALFVQREAMFFGPAVFEWMFQEIGNLPMVLDLDDATYVPYESPTYGPIGTRLKFFGKTDWLIRRAAAVTCGNRFIAEYVESKGTSAVVVPTVVDLDVFRPRESPVTDDDVLTLGWIGTHSTYPSLEWLSPVLQRLACDHHFVLRVVGSGREKIEIDGVTVENLRWSMNREVEDFRNLDIGLYPIVTSASASEEWIKGKSGFKAVQYMAVGVPFVMSPIGVCAEIGINGETHLNAESAEDWYNSLNNLLSNPQLRMQMGQSARAHSVVNYSLATIIDRIEMLFGNVTRDRKAIG